MPREPDRQQLGTASPLTAAAGCHWAEIAEKCGSTRCQKQLEASWVLRAIGPRSTASFFQFLHFQFYFWFLLWLFSCCRLDWTCNKCCDLLFHFYIFVCLRNRRKLCVAHILMMKSVVGIKQCFHVISPLIDTCHQIRDPSLSFVFPSCCFCLSLFWRTARS